MNVLLCKMFKVVIRLKFLVNLCDLLFCHACKKISMVVFGLKILKV